MYSLIFENHLDLDSVMKNFQRCVIAVHDISQYPGWLKRPIDRPEVTTKKPPKGSSRSKRLEITKIVKIIFMLLCARLMYVCKCKLFTQFKVCNIFQNPICVDL